RHGTSLCIPYQALQLVTPMRRNCRVGMQRKAVDTGTPRPGEPWRLTLNAKACTDAAYLLASSFAESDALLDRRRHGAGELRGGVAQGIIPGGHGRLYAHLQVAQLAELTDDPPADFLYHFCYIGIAGRLAREKAGFATFVSAIEVDPLQEDAMEMEVQIQSTAKALEKGDRARVDVRPLVTVCARLVDVIL